MNRPFLPFAGRAAVTALLCSTLTLTFAMAADDSVATGNPLLRPSTLPFGFPQFDQIREEHFIPAYEAATAEELREVDAIAKESAEPSFANTLVALERAGQTRTRVEIIFNGLVGVMLTDGMRKLQTEMAPRIAAHKDAVRMNPELFARIDQLFQKREQLKLSPEDDRLLEKTHQDFVRAGAKLSPSDKEKLKALNAEIASLQASFSQKVVNATNAAGVLVDTREELKGLSENQINAAAAAAKAAGKEGKFLIALMNTTGQPSLAALENRELRQRIMAASLARGTLEGENDTRPIVLRLAELRAHRAQLLGYKTHAAYQLEDQTAKTVEAVNEMMAKITPAAVANARREAEDMQKIIDAEDSGFALTAADWAFYAEKVRRARYAFDEAELRPYFELDRVFNDGVFFAATKLFGITFKQRTDLPVYHPDVRVYEVFERSGERLAFFILDPYARPTKRGGAWMNAYVPQSSLLGQKPVVGNHLNIPKPSEGEPTLLTYDEVVTAFHEFGHALHGMFSNVTYPKFSGTSVPRDFVEFPSQVYEMWVTWPDVLQNYAKHHKTGEPIPQELVRKLQDSEKFNQGFQTTEYVAAVLLDQAWHQLTPEQLPADVVTFEAEALKKAGVDFSPVPPRYRSTYFNHVFSLSYSAGYYAYIWSEVLDAATVDWFKANGGLTPENGEHMRRALLSRGGSVEAMKLFREFYGSEPKIDPLLKRRGLEATPASGM